VIAVGAITFHFPGAVCPACVLPATCTTATGGGRSVVIHPSMPAGGATQAGRPRPPVGSVKGIPWTVVVVPIEINIRIEAASGGSSILNL
jgi:hypothetical protein